MLYTTRPDTFNSKMAGSACFVEFNKKFLILKRAPTAHQGGVWTAAPGGKIELGETPLEAVVRELWEETGIRETPKELGTVYYVFPDMQYTLHLFYLRLQAEPTVKLQPMEHTEFDWKNFEEILKLPIMRGGAECIAYASREIAKFN